MGKLKYMKRTKPAKVHKLRAQAAVEPWTQQQYSGAFKQTAYYNPSPQTKTPEAAFHHMQTVQVSSLNKQEDNRHNWPLWLTTQLDAHVHQFDCEVHHAPVHQQVTVWGQETRTSYSFHQWIWWLPSRKSRVTHSYTPYWVSGTTKSSISGHRHKRISHPWPWISKIDGFHTFPRDKSTKSTEADTITQDTCSHEGHNSKSTKVQGDKQDGSRSETPKCPTAWQCCTHHWEETEPTHHQRTHIEGVQWCLQWNRDNTRGWVPHQAEEKDYKPVQHTPQSVPVRLKPAYKEELQWLCSGNIITPVCKYTEWTNSIVPVRKATDR